jgi:hypothetical protein
MQKSIAIKLSFFIGIMTLLIAACAPVKEVPKTSAALIKNDKDTTQYQVIIIDPGFDQWYLTNFTEAKDRSNEYYRYKNMVAVINWNNNYNTGRYGRVIESYIDYRPNIDYGLDVNRKIYWYFKYVDSVFGIYLF